MESGNINTDGEPIINRFLGNLPKEMLGLKVTPFTTLGKGGEESVIAIKEQKFCKKKEVPACVTEGYHHNCKIDISLTNHCRSRERLGR